MEYSAVTQPPGTFCAFIQRGTSAAMKARNSSAVLPTGSMLSLARDLMTSGSFEAFTASALSLFTMAAGVPPGARPFGGLVYRQAMEYLNGVRDEAATRALIAQENRKYARRQLIWFKKEPNLVWFDGPGTNAEVQDSVIRELAARDLLKD